jgi:fatty-acyl-CoA synthase
VSDGNDWLDELVSQPPTALPQRIEQSIEIWDPQFTVISTGSEESMRLADLHADAIRVAARLQARGVSPGSPVAVAGLTSRPLVTAVEAIWLLGAAVVMLPIPMRIRDVGALAADTVARAKFANASFLLVDELFAGLLADDERDAAVPLMRLADLSHGSSGGDVADVDLPAVDPSAVAVMQFTSGTTGSPRLVQITHAQIHANHLAIAQSVRLRPGDDVALSWLPLYHDMGMIGFLALPMCGARHTIVCSPETFVMSPGSWMENVSRFGATITGGPSFAFSLATRKLVTGGHDDPALASLRVAFNGSEPIDVEAVDAFVRAGRAHGLGDAVLPVYGMAEATLLVSCPPPGRPVARDIVDGELLRREQRAVTASEGRAGTRKLAHLGAAVDGIEIRLTRSDGDTVAEDRLVGEIEIRGESVVTSYVRRPDLSAEAFRDGWLRTGDRGYFLEGEVIVCGRSKDVIIVAGRNVDPEEVEWAASKVDGVRSGNVIAFGHDRGERRREMVTVVAECRGPDRDLRKRIASAVNAAVGLWPDDIVLVAPGSLPKTSSGKLQRFVCRDAYLSSELAEL